MSNLPRLSDLSIDITTGELARRRNLPFEFDYALPQGWLDDWRYEEFDPRGQVVWGYPDRYLFGVPVPLTQEAEEALEAKYGKQAWGGLC